MSKCALCGNEAKLMQSHIIPKLVYRRIRSHPNSRFRSMDNFGRELQDGEKRPMLCHDCEEKFSELETWYARSFLDEYLNTDIIPSVTEQNKLGDYILSVAWRILWDDLYRLGSFQGESCREKIEEFEEKARSYLLNGGSDDFFVNKIYKLSDLVQCSEDFSDRALFGYTVNNPFYGCFVIVYYAGLVYVTLYKQPRRMVIALDAKFPSLLEVIQEEVVLELTELQKQMKINYTPEFVAKMKKRYNVSST